MESEIKKFEMLEKVNHNVGNYEAIAHAYEAYCAKPLLIIALYEITTQPAWFGLTVKDVRTEIGYGYFTYNQYGSDISAVVEELRQKVIDNSGTIIPKKLTEELVSFVTKPYVTRAKTIEDALSEE